MIYKCGGIDKRTIEKFEKVSTLPASGCLALSFPLHAPGRTEPTRLPELHAVGLPTLLVQGERDPMGRPEEFPADLAAALEEAGLRAAFDAMPPSHRKAHVTVIEEAKAAATRERRIAAAVAKIGADRA